MAGMAQELEKQRRQIETLKAVSERLCAKNERLEAKSEAVNQVVAQTQSHQFIFSGLRLAVCAIVCSFGESMLPRRRRGFGDA